jgi:hypothetical protein
LDVLTAFHECILAMPAHTIEGMQAKARVTFWCRQGEIDRDDECTDMGSAMSIVVDLLRMQGISPMSSNEYHLRFVQQGKVQT